MTSKDASLSITDDIVALLKHCQALLSEKGGVTRPTREDDPFANRIRQSYAMHMLYAGIPLKVLQSLMGHKSISSTEVYTKVFALDVAARHRVQFQMPGTEAVAMLKGQV